MSTPPFPRARREMAPGYPPRFPVPDDKVPWSVAWSAYAPPYHVDPHVIARDRTKVPGGWADPEDVRAVTLPANVDRDALGRPHNPMGRTGIAGRGRLGRWGPNPAADPIVLWWKDGRLCAVLIERTTPVLVDGASLHPWAFPGGMADDGEEPAATLARELEEETGIRLSFDDARVVYQGPVDDPRTTDHAWIETTAAYVLVPDNGVAAIEHAMQASDDARAVRAVEVDRALLGKMYANHASLMRAALSDLAGRDDVPRALAVHAGQAGS